MRGAFATEVGPREERELGVLQPFAWATGLPADGKVTETRLAGGLPYQHRLLFDSVSDFRAETKKRSPRYALEATRPLEHQFLLREEARLFAGMVFDDLRRAQVAIRTTRDNEIDRLAAIVLRADGETRVMVPDDDSTDAEKALLFRFNATLKKVDPDILEGHDLFNGALTVLRDRAKALKVPVAWGRFGEKASFRSSRLRVAERMVDYLRCDVPGRTLFDTRLAVQLYDVTTRDLEGYSLEDVGPYFGVTVEPGEGEEPTLVGETETVAGLAGILLPTYFAQCANFPMLLSEILLRGSAAKVDLLLTEKYFRAGHSLPDYPEVSTFEGAFTKSFEEGVFRHVLHYDVASLYPSLLLQIGRNPANDALGIFIPLLTEIRAERLRYKVLARESDSEAERREYQARQSAYKILINSFYGYLGFAGGRFADRDLAAEVTAQGRELIQQLIARFQELGATVLEADTDGIYIASEEHFAEPEKLLAEAARDLPDGIDLEYDGAYEAMLCYKAKNYALYDGETITVKGSALRSRATEPFLKELTDAWIAHSLGASEDSPLDLAESWRDAIAASTFAVQRLAKSEYLSQHPETYRKAVEQGGKPRRASLEVALREDPVPRMGERVRYYLLPKEKGVTSDWQRARSLDQFDADHPYDPKTYLKKLDDWLKRYAPLVRGADSGRAQEELFSS